jgi:hypothetical protein
MIVLSAQRAVSSVPAARRAGSVVLAAQDVWPSNIAADSRAHCCTSATLSICAPRRLILSARIAWWNGRGRRSRAIDLRSMVTWGKLEKSD